MRFPCSNSDHATAIWCHSTRIEDATATDIRARDANDCYGDSSCHVFLDGSFAALGWPRYEAEQVFDRASGSNNDDLIERMVSVLAESELRRLVAAAY